MTKQLIHPECLQGELMLKNMTKASFVKLNIPGKRMGKVSYDGLGNKLKAEDWFPVFISKAEFKSKKISLMDFRRSLVSKGY